MLRALRQSTPEIIGATLVSSDGFIVLKQPSATPPSTSRC
jgi:predicted regulator of Ras-like GTPase activity (Roadblock/LC7/MglB family)